MDNKTFPYNRIVQWLAGPVSAGVGLLVAYLGTHIDIVRLHQAAAVQDLTALGMMAVGAGVTYAAHHKWLTNLGHTIYAQEAAAGTIVNNLAAPLDDEDISPVEEPADVPGVDPPQDVPTSG